MVAVFIGNRPASIQSVTHQVIAALAAPGQGRGQEIYLQVLNEITNTADNTFDYSAPRIYSFKSNMLQFPTSGYMQNGDAAVATLYGDNFGIGRDITIQIGPLDRNILVQTMEVDHMQINITIPPGEGLNLTIYINVSHHWIFRNNIYQL